MKHIRARNVNDALPAGVHLLLNCGIPQETRAGEVLRVPEPVVTTYDNPDECVLLWPERDANPFFHLMEALWMLGGRDDVAFIEQFNPRMATFSDDGARFTGAYGHRWRHHFDRDQLLWAIQRLRTDPSDRRTVISMWDSSGDPLLADAKTLDVPCNTHIYLDASMRRLDLAVCCRSNDMVWGAYGTNAVHFSILQQFIAAQVGLPTGTLTQFSFNFHAYLDVLEKVKEVQIHALDPLRTVDRNPYSNLRCHPLCQLPTGQWLAELEMFLDQPATIGFRDPFFKRVAVPMRMAHMAWREGRDWAGVERWLSRCEAEDWALAGKLWINRRRREYNENKAAGDS